MDTMTEEDVQSLKVGDIIYDKDNGIVVVAELCEYTLKPKVRRSLGIKRTIYETPSVIARTYTIHKKEYSNGQVN